MTDHPHTYPGDGREECLTCGKYVWRVTHSCKGVPVTPAAAERYRQFPWIQPRLSAEGRAELRAKSDLIEYEGLCDLPGCSQPAVELVASDAVRVGEAYVECVERYVCRWHRANPFPEQAPAD